MSGPAPATLARRAAWRRRARTLLSHGLLLAWAGASLWLVTDYLLARGAGDPAQTADLRTLRDLVAGASFVILAATVLGARLMWAAGSRADADQPAPAESVDHLAGAVDHLAEQMHAQLAELSVQALRDPLTRLPNRALFMDALRRALARARRRGTDVALLYIDLDDFKGVNDTFGHEGGDLLLTAIAQRLQASLRSEDLAARLGGDEFAVLIDEVGGQDEARLMGERVLDRLQTPVEIAGRQVVPGASVGVAAGGTSRIYADAEALVRDADTAMYRAKGRGKGHCVIYEGEPGEGGGRGAGGGHRPGAAPLTGDADHTRWFAGVSLPQIEPAVPSTRLN